MNYSCGSRTDLHVQSITLTGHIYRDVILEQHLRLFRGALGVEFLFMYDNTHPHRAHIVDECLQSEDITRMDWPAYSPDLNPIEHVWHILGRRIAARQPPPPCLPGLRRALLDEWCNIPQDQIGNLILSMPRRSVDQSAANCLEEAVQPFTAMWSRCRLLSADVPFLHLLPIFRVVRCSSVHCFQTRITVDLFRSTRAPIAR
ncbi:transposable element Tcb2 transposase [Trichonephila clavipes]|nr:transposable element Tcb2 transposase [Trichonephila clavipes]